MSASVGVKAGEEKTVQKEWTDRQKMEHLFMEEAGLDPDTETVTSVLGILWENRITKAWQVAKLPDSILERLFPHGEALQEYLLVASVREILQQWQSQPQGEPASSSNNEAYSMVAKAISAFTTECEKARKQRKRGKSSDSEAELENKYDCTASLKRYGITNVPNTHVAKERGMEKWSKKAVTSFATRKSFLIHEPVTSFQPIWMEDKDRAKDQSQIPTHAHWVASWWARALTQISAQGTCDKETVTVSDLLVQFLNANKVAIQKTTRAGWEYDRHHWADLSDRLRRREPDMDVAKLFRTVDNNEVQDAVDRVSEQAQSKVKAQPTTTTPSTPAGKGTKGGKDHFGGRGGKGQGDRFGSGGIPGFGKGGGKDWGKDAGKSAAAKTAKGLKAAKSKLRNLRQQIKEEASK